MPDEAERGYFDLGGLPAGPVDRRERDLVFWEKQMAAIRVLLDRDHVGLEELRDAFETFGAALYGSLGFFERMYEATLRVLERKGVATRSDIEARVEALALCVRPASAAPARGRRAARSLRRPLSRRRRARCAAVAPRTALPRAARRTRGARRLHRGRGSPSHRAHRGTRAAPRRTRRRARLDRRGVQGAHSRRRHGRLRRIRHSRSWTAA